MKPALEFRRVQIALAVVGFAIALSSCGSQDADYDFGQYSPEDTMPLAQEDENAPAGLVDVDNESLITDLPSFNLRTRDGESYTQFDVRRSAYAGSRGTFRGYECTVDCSGHEAGYEWAEENFVDDPDDCVGNSFSFEEGCIAYLEENEPYAIRSADISRPSLIPRPSITPNRNGETTTYSDGTTATRIGNTTIFSDGTTANRIGDTTIYSDGTTAHQIGDTTIFSDGTTANRIGDTTIFSDGTTCNTIGSTTICN